jgi:serine/threonine-protein kinase
MSHPPADEAITEFQKVGRLSGDAAFSAAFIAHAYAVSHREDKAREIIDDLMRLSKSRYVSPEDFAAIYIGLRDKDMAFKLLNKACEERTISMAYIKVEPLYDSLRGDPRYAELVRRIGLEQ